jgi:hypothetical protein
MTVQWRYRVQQISLESLLPWGTSSKVAITSFSRLRHHSTTARNKKRNFSWLSLVIAARNISNMMLFSTKTFLLLSSSSFMLARGDDTWCDRDVNNSHKKKKKNSQRKFDFIVAGAGPGGGVVASRLALAGFKTLLLDAGPDYDSPLTQVPLFWPLSTVQPEIEWAFRTKNTDLVKDRNNTLYPRASMVGGCATHNVSSD